jgi:hypothetical protein
MTAEKLNTGLKLSQLTAFKTFGDTPASLWENHRFNTKPERPKVERTFSLFPVRRQTEIRRHCPNPGWFDLVPLAEKVHPASDRFLVVALERRMVPSQER